MDLLAMAPWVTSACFEGEGANESSGAPDHQGWLRTGDLATIGADGCIALADRAKDVIKSGGE